MLRIHHAVLHAFDFEVGEAYLSEGELPLGERQIKSYVQRLLRKCSGNAESRHGEFGEGVLFAEQLNAYLTGGNDFLGMSVQVAQWFWEELRRMDSVEQCDLLVAEFEETVDAKEKGEAPSFDGPVPSFFAVLVLPRKLAFAHDVSGGDNAIYRHDATLPNPTQKIDSFLLVDEQTMSVEFCDRPRLIAGRETHVIGDEFLRCAATAKASSREVVETVSVIVQDVAEEYGLTPAVEVSRAKAAVARAADVEQVVSPEAVGREVFAEQPEALERFEREVQERQLPEEVPVRRGVANRLTRTHKIRTDTGVEISFPSDLAERPGYIEFIEEDDGHTTIAIRGVAHIENR